MADKGRDSGDGHQKVLHTRQITGTEILNVCSTTGDYVNSVNWRHIMSMFYTDSVVNSQCPMPIANTLNYTIIYYHTYTYIIHIILYYVGTVR